MDAKMISTSWKYNLGLVCDTVQSILSIQEDARGCANFRVPAMDRGEHKGVGIFVLMK